MVSERRIDAGSCRSVATLPACYTPLEPEAAPSYDPALTISILMNQPNA